MAHRTTWLRSDFTTVEQCRCDEQPKIEKNLVCRDGKVTYENLDESTEFITSYKNTEGNWHRGCLPIADRPDGANILTVTIPTADGGSYAYAVFAGAKPEISVLRNDAECQAVLADGKLMAAFGGDAEITVGEKTVSGTAGELLILDI